LDLIDRFYDPLIARAFARDTDAMIEQAA